MMITPIVYRNQTAEQLFGRREDTTKNVEEAAKKIIDDVRARGDSALYDYARRFDGYEGKSLKVSDEEFEEAERLVPESFKGVLRRSAENIAEFHSRQKREDFEIEKEGKILGQLILPVESAGIYVPGGTAAYPSTVLMNAIPAKIAGVKNLYMATPVKADGKVRPEVLVAAKICGVDGVFKMGGAQAVAAFAYGTQTVPKVDKITGPGRDFVAAAKKLVYGVACDIDMIAGPSEILVVADSGADPDKVAADLLSQAEHDVLASAILLTDCAPLAQEVSKRLEVRLLGLPRKEIAGKSLQNNCKIIITPDIDTAVGLSNEYAPEHLELAVEEPFKYLQKVKSAGSVFLGYDCPEAVGDYYAGANHTLPTSGTARFSSPLGVDDFVKSTQYIYYDNSALRAAAKDIVDFARSEGLDAHAESVLARVKK